MRKKKIVIFSGGSGNANLIKALSNYEFIDLKILINGYDDGKSTGYLRDKISNMLGPSDFRKNCVNILSKDKKNKNLVNILEYRFKNNNDYKNIIKYLLKKNFDNNKLIFCFEELNWTQHNNIKEPIKIFNSFFKNKPFQFKDISLGNIVFSGIFLKTKNFNKTVKIFTSIFGLNKKIYNVTNGKNLFLMGITSAGNILKKEEEIVLNKRREMIEDIYLVSKKIKIKKNINKKLKISLLKKNEIFPKMNDEIKKIIDEADHIIYGSGTEHSSLYPTYLTSNLEKIIHNSKAKKHFIGNIHYDDDIIKETSASVIDKFYYYFSKKKNHNINFKLVDNFFLNKFDPLDKNSEHERYIKVGILNKSIKKKVKYLDCEKENGGHLPLVLLKKLFNKKIINTNYIYSTVSFIIPIKNEEKEIPKLILQLKKIKYLLHNLSYEIIFIDGGSNDNSENLLSSFKAAKHYRFNNIKRGEAINFGIKKSKGEIIVIFPSDNEYSIEDSIKLIHEIYEKKSMAVYGSRIIKLLNLNSLIKKVYRNNYLGFFISKYGGILISFITLILYNRYLTDPLTTLKAFDSKLIKSLQLRCKGLDLDAEIFYKITNRKIYIAEIPVNYNPRNYSQGKKTTIIDGFIYLYRLILIKIFY